MVGILVVHKIEKDRYLECLRSVDAPRWRAIVESRSYKWFGSFSPGLIRQAFGSDDGAPLLAAACSSYRRSEVFFFAAFIFAMLLTSLAPVLAGAK